MEICLKQFSYCVLERNIEPVAANINKKTIKAHEFKY